MAVIFTYEKNMMNEVDKEMKNGDVSSFKNIFYIKQ